nr:hypothetical protein [Alphaproteobacteria bacterium]
MQKLLYQTKNMSPFRIMALLLGASLPCFYFGQALGILCVLLAFATMLHPEIFVKIPETIRQLWQTPERKFLVVAFLSMLPAVFLSIDILQSARVWILAVIMLGLFSCLTVFKHATLNDKLLVIKIFLIGLLLWNSLIAFAYHVEPHWLFHLWSIRTQLGIVEKGYWYYVHSVPKLQLNGSFVLLPLLIYCVMIYLRQFYWRIIMLLLIISFIILTIALGNRALLAGTIAVLIVATFSVWSCKKEAIFIKIVTLILTILTLIIFFLFFFIPREQKIDLFAFSSEEKNTIQVENSDDGLLENSDDGLLENSDDGLLDNSDDGLLDNSDDGLLDNSDDGLLDNSDDGLLDNSDDVLL